MRILLLSTYFRPDVAANGVIMSKLADEFVAQGHEVTVVTTVPHYDVNHIWPQYSGKLSYREVTGGMTIYRLFTHVAEEKESIPQRLLAYGSFHALSLARCLSLPKHDVMLVPSPPLSIGIIADIVRRVRNIPFVYNVQDIWPDVAIRAGVLKDPKTIARLRRMEDYVYRRAAAIAVISEGFRQNLMAKGVPENKISVISNFNDIEHIAPRPKCNSFSQAHGLGNKFVVLFAGNMGFSQGLETVLDAAKMLEHYREVHFLMVGNGSSRASAESYSAQLGSRNVQFLPYQPHAMVPELYGTADVCLIPLRKGFTSESVPSKLFAIMSAARPAVASVDEGCETATLLARAAAGRTVPPEDPGALAKAILHYYLNPEERIREGLNGRRCAEAEFSPAAIAASYLDVLGSAVKRRP